MIIDANRFLRDLRLPYFTLAKIREMTLGEDIYFFDFQGPGHPASGIDNPAKAIGKVERKRGFYVFSALWMLHIGKVKRRGHIWVPELKFKLLPGRKIQLLSEDAELKSSALEQLTRLFRLAHRLHQMALAAGENKDAYLLKPSLGPYHMHCGQKVKFLNRLTASA